MANTLRYFTIIPRAHVGYLVNKPLRAAGMSADNSPLSHGGHIVPGDQKKLCFTTLSLAPTVLTARLCVVKQSFFGLPGQYGRRVTKANVCS